MNGGTLPLVLIGSGGHARVVIDAARRAGMAIAGLLDEGRRTADNVDAVTVLGGDERLHAADAAEFRYHIGIADPASRERLRTAIEGRGLRIATIVHPAAVASKLAEIGDGCFLAAGAIVNPGSRLGPGVVVNTGAQIDHDAEVGADCHIAPGAILCGNVRCDAQVFIGAGATLIPGIKIGKGATIGAGATVISDVAVGATVAGSPAVPISRP